MYTFVIYMCYILLYIDLIEVSDFAICPPIFPGRSFESLSSYIIFVTQTVVVQSNLVLNEWISPMKFYVVRNCYCRITPSLL